jgi:hypothetical protein
MIHGFGVNQTPRVKLSVFPIISKSREGSSKNPVNS